MEEYSGTIGTAFWKIKYLGDIRIRLIEYSINYSADHWYNKGHIMYSIDGEMTIELKDESTVMLRKGISFVASMTPLAIGHLLTKVLDYLLWIEMFKFLAYQYSI